MLDLIDKEPAQDMNRWITCWSSSFITKAFFFITKAWLFIYTGSLYLSFTVVGWLFIYISGIGQALLLRLDYSFIVMDCWLLGSV